MTKLMEVDLEKKLAEFCSYYDENHSVLLSASDIFKTLISALLVDKIPVDSVTSRIKDRDECISKFKRKYLSDLEKEGVDFDIKNYITDIVGLRIVCLYIEDIKPIQNLVEGNFEEIEITDKSSQLDSTEDKFGYKGLHLDLKLNNVRISLPEYEKFKDVAFELQIRTIIQDAWSVLDHKIKYKKSIPIDLKRRINRLSALFEVADEEFLRIKGETLKEQEKAKTEIIQQSEQLRDTLDVFKFLLVAESHFPTYYFIEHKADGFVVELLNIDTHFSTNELIQAVRDNKEVVERYANQSSSYMNPYTAIRHCIYLLDRAKYRAILYDAQRNAFERWFNAIRSV